MEHQTIHIELAHILEIANKGIRRAAVFMGVGVNVAEDKSFKKYELTDKTNIQIIPSNLDDETIGHIKKEFEIWVIANGLRELIEAFSIYLDEIYNACLLIEIVNNHLERANYSKYCRKYAKQGFPNKLNLMKQKFGIHPMHEDYINSIYKVRNCLAHRRGIVRKDDCKEGSSLKIKWLGIDANIITPSGQQHSALDVPEEGIFLPEGGKLVVTNIEKEKTYNIGEIVKIDANMLSEICWYMLNEAYSIFDRTINYMKASGIKINDYRKA